MVERRLFIEPKKERVPLPNFEPFVNKAKLGDQDAYEELDRYLRPRLTNYFSARLALPDKADDLVQSTLEKVSGNLTKFTPREQGHFSQQFVGWCFIIARNTLIDRFRKEARAAKSVPITDFNGKNNFPDDHDEKKGSQQKALSLVFREKLAEILTERRMQMVNLALDGKSNADIAFQLGLTEGTVKTSLWEARKKIEEELIFPAGYISSVKSKLRAEGKAFPTALYRTGRLDSIKFLGVWYVPKEKLKQYYQQQTSSQEFLSNNGYVPLSEIASPNEWDYLSTYRRDLLIVRKRRLYILPESLNEFRKGRTENPSKIVPPSPQFSSLSTFETTSRDRNVLYKAIRRGALEAIKNKGVWFTTQEAVDNYRQNK